MFASGVLGVVILGLLVILVFERVRTATLAVLMPLLGIVVPVQAQPMSVPPTSLGINASTPVWYLNGRAFANLALGGEWMDASVGGWKNLDPRHIGPNGEIQSFPASGKVARMLSRPITGPNGKDIRCTYSGKVSVTIRGPINNVQQSSGSLRFRWTNSWSNDPAFITVAPQGAGSTFSDLDCRETDMPAAQRFAPEFIASMRGYKVIRYMDWQRTNANQPVRWATRQTPKSIEIIVRDGVSIEDMILLSNQTGTDMWLSVPWNADDDYVARFAKAVHDGIPSNRTVYVEVGNEVWNWGFPVAKQAASEGVQRALAGDAGTAHQFRYAQRTIEAMKIWSAAFADRPGRLVRVVSTQHFAPPRAELVFRYPGLAANVDALATAPYFGHDLIGAGKPAIASAVLGGLDAAILQTMALTLQNKAIAARNGKRYLAYEAGQHIVTPDIAVNQSIQRDQRMYLAYKRYLAAWRAAIGDTMMVFAYVSPVGKSGAWGLQEHAGQSPAEAPKYRAVLEELGK